MKFKSELNENVKAELQKLREAEESAGDGDTIHVNPTSSSSSSKKSDKRVISFTFALWSPSVGLHAEGLA